MWQSLVEIEIIPLRISITLLRSKRCNTVISLWVGLIHVKLINTCIARMSPTLNRSSVLQCFERANAIEICN